MRVLEICLKAFRLGGGEFQLKVDQVNQEKKKNNQENQDAFYGHASLATIQRSLTCYRQNEN